MCRQMVYLERLFPTSKVLHHYDIMEVGMINTDYCRGLLNTRGGTKISDCGQPIYVGMDLQSFIHIEI